MMYDRCSQFKMLGYSSMAIGNGRMLLLVKTTTDISEVTVTTFSLTV
jgi:hypothetical protein